MTEDSILHPLQGIDTLEVLRREITTISEMALIQRVGSKETKDAALAVGADIKRMRKALDERRKAITGPMQDNVKRIIAFADKLDEPLARAESHIRSQAVAYAEVIAAEQRKQAAALEMEKHRIRREEEIKMRNAAALADSVEDELKAKRVIEQQTRSQEAAAAASAREIKSNAVKGASDVWKFEVTDAAMVPREFLIPDMQALRQAVNYRKLRDIPGVKIWAEKSVRLG